LIKLDLHPSASLVQISFTLTTEVLGNIVLKYLVENVFRMSNWKIINKQNTKALGNKKDLENLQAGLRNTPAKDKRNRWSIGMATCKCIMLSNYKF